MSTARTIVWPGLSGIQYQYWIYPISDFLFKAEPGNYIFAREQPDGHVAIYAGETCNLSERFDNHHKLRCILRHGATHIHAHVSAYDDEVRRYEEADIIARWQPLCNG
jgi:hypothetical protein